MPRLLGLLAPGGALAVQMPRNYEAASHRLMREIAAQPAWRDKLVDLRTLYPVATPEAYLRWLQPIAADCVLWETDYWMRLDGDNPVLEWVKGTGLRPYLDALDEPDRQRFLARYSDAVKAAYPPEPDGSTLFPFKRLFFVARRS